MSADLGRRLARELFETVPAIMQPVTAEMRRMDIPMPMPHFRALMIITHAGPCTLTGLAEKQHVSLPTMSNTVSVLVERGWVERVADDHDRRRAEVRLTPEGEEAARNVQARIERLLGERFAALSPEEVERVRAGLAVLRRAFRETEAQAGGNA